MKAVLILATVGLAACASSGTKESSGTTPTRDRFGVRVVGPGGTATLTERNDVEVTSGIVAQTPAVAWRALNLAFDSLGLPATLRDSTGGRMVAENLKVRRRLGGVALSRYFDCGTTQIGPNSDSYELMITIDVKLNPGTSGTTNVEITTDARAKPVTFNQAYQSCMVLGTLDERIRTLMRTAPH